MERSFKAEVESLKLGNGQVFHGEGILAVTKALLQSGVSYVGGYQGAPVSHMMDVLNDARDIMDELGIHIVCDGRTERTTVDFWTAIRKWIEPIVGRCDFPPGDQAAACRSNHRRFCHPRPSRFVCGIPEQS